MLTDFTHPKRYRAQNPVKANLPERIIMGVIKRGWRQKEILVFYLAHRIQIDRAFSPDSWGNTDMGRWPMLV